MANGIDPRILLGINNDLGLGNLAQGVQGGLQIAQSFQKLQAGREAATDRQTARADKATSKQDKLEANELITNIAPIYDPANPQAALAAIQASTVLDDEDKQALIQSLQDPRLFQATIQESNRVLGIATKAVDPIETEKLIIRREELAARQAADIERAAVQRETIAARRAADDQSRLAARQAIQAKIVAAELSDDRKLATQAKIDTNKLNIKRIGELSQGAKGRTEAIKKAKQFMRSLDSSVLKTAQDLFPDEDTGIGLQATSGTSRTILDFLPGVFTDQAAFDQKFNAFSEVAARQQLKAAGEIRPTDADVEGMKRAMFGIGRDEPVNIQLLGEFIIDQQNLDEELEDLREAKEQGNLSVFTGSPPTVNNAPQVIRFDAQGNIVQ